MKKLISLTFATVALGSLFISLPASAGVDSPEAERFCAEYGDLTDSEDVVMALQNFIGEIENIEIDDLIALTDIGEEIEDGEDLDDICD